MSFESVLILAMGIIASEIIVAINLKRKVKKW